MRLYYFLPSRSITATTSLNIRHYYSTSEIVSLTSTERHIHRHGSSRFMTMSRSTTSPITEMKSSPLCFSRLPLLPSTPIIQPSIPRFWRII